ncbi:MAG: MFS transporter [Verrucomicrobiia bacterium]
MTTENSVKMPHGVGNAFAFQVFNTMSFTIVLSTPMLLYFKRLDASATVLGIVVALPNLLNILQIPAAQFVEKMGYRAFVLRGWLVRALFILAMAVVPLLPAKIDATTRIALMLFLLFGYNASRGISLCGFLPWVTHWIPEPVRGRYVSRDQMWSAVATLVTMILAAVYLTKPEARLSYAFLFLGSLVTALVSLLFLRRIPDVPVPPYAASREKVPYKQMLLHPPFLKILIYDAVLLTALAGSSVFWIPFLRDTFGASDAFILWMMVAWSVVMTVSLWGFGHLIDRVGSRPLLGLGTVSFIIHFSLWGALAARVLPFNWVTLGAIQLTSGIGNSLYNLANTRLVMATVPPMGRSHFFALFTVVTSLVLGVLPVFWGILLDSLAGWGTTWSAWQWNQYSLLYCALMLIVIVALVLRKRLSEPRAMTTDAFLRELLVETPGRALSRLLARRPFS